MDMYIYIYLYTDGREHIFLDDLNAHTNTRAHTQTHNDTHTHQQSHDFQCTRTQTQQKTTTSGHFTSQGAHLEHTNIHTHTKNTTVNLNEQATQRIQIIHGYVGTLSGRLQPATAKHPPWQHGSRQRGAQKHQHRLLCRGRLLHAKVENAPAS
jgi:hypothetical protein